MFCKHFHSCSLEPGRLRWPLTWKSLWSLWNQRRLDRRRRAETRLWRMKKQTWAQTGRRFQALASVTSLPSLWICPRAACRHPSQLAMQGAWSPLRLPPSRPGSAPTPGSAETRWMWGWFNRLDLCKHSLLSSFMSAWPLGEIKGSFIWLLILNKCVVETRGKHVIWKTSLVWFYCRTEE